MLLPAIKLLRYGLGNPVSRQILSIGLSFCDSCRMSRLQHALMIYLERARAYTLRCRLYSSMLCALINLGLYTFDVDRRSLVSVAFSGGEPLMARDFFDVAVKVKEEGMYLAIATNGTLITRRVAKRLKALGTDYVEVSLDFADARSHDAFRGVKGAFNKALEGVQNCVAEGIYTGIATTATKLNLWQIPEIIDLARRLRVKRFICFNFIPTGRGRESLELDLTPEEREQLLTRLFHENKVGGIEVLSTAPQYARVSLQCSGGADVAPTHFYLGEAPWDLKALAEFIGGCGAGRLYCALQPNCDVSPCVFMPQLIVGNVRKQRFTDVWRESKVLAKLRDRDLLQSNCGSCQYRFICGGCRARALAYFNDALAPDPGCIRNRSPSGPGARQLSSLEGGNS